MQKYLLAAAFLLAVLYCPAQSSTSSSIWAPIPKKPSLNEQNLVKIGDYFYSMLHKGGNFVMSFGKKGTIKKFNTKLEPFNEATFKSAGQESYLRMFSMDDRLYLLHFSSQQLSAVEIDLETLKPSGTPVAISSTERRAYTSVTMAQSDDGAYSSVMLLTSKNGVQEAEIFCFDRNFKLCYKEQATFKGDGLIAIMLYSWMLVDKQGNTFVLVKKQGGNYTLDHILWQRYRSGGTHQEFVTYGEKSNVGYIRMTDADSFLVLGSFYPDIWPAPNKERGIGLKIYDKHDPSNIREINIPIPELSPYVAPHPFRSRADVEDYEGLATTQIRHWPGHGYLLMGETIRFFSNKGVAVLEQREGLVVFLDEAFNIRTAIPIIKVSPNYLYEGAVFVNPTPEAAYLFFNARFSTPFSPIRGGGIYGEGFVRMTIYPNGSYTTDLMDTSGKNDKFDVYYMRPINNNEYFLSARGWIPTKKQFGILKFP